MARATATAKINLALVVGPRRDDAKHEVATVLQRLDVADRVAVEPSPHLRVEGFAEDTIVRAALQALAERAGARPGWRVRLVKRIPVAAGLGGGSSDAASALRLANATLSEPLADDELHALAATVGADVPFFLRSGPQLGTGDGSELRPVELPQDYWVVLLVPRDVTKASTRAVYEAFDARGGAAGFAERRAELLEALAAVHEPVDLARLPQNDLASSPLATRLEQLGAFRADVSGAGPTVYGLFLERGAAGQAARSLGRAGQALVAAPAWYG